MTYIFFLLRKKSGIFQSVIVYREVQNSSFSKIQKKKFRYHKFILMTLFSLKWDFPLVLKKAFLQLLRFFPLFFSPLFLLVKFNLVDWQTELHLSAFNWTKYWIQDKTLAEVLTLNWAHTMETGLSKPFVNYKLQKL